MLRYLTQERTFASLYHVIAVPPSAIVRAEAMSTLDTLKFHHLPQQLQRPLLADIPERLCPNIQRAEGRTQDMNRTSLGANGAPASTTYDRRTCPVFASGNIPPYVHGVLMENRSFINGQRTSRRDSNVQALGRYTKLEYVCAQE